MLNLKLFKLGEKAELLNPKIVRLEKDIQEIVERNMEDLLNIKFLKSEYKVSSGGRIDSIGIDEFNCPVIIEYKRSSNVNIIVQSLSYLNAIKENKKDFERLCYETYEINEVNWSDLKIICIASSYNKHDEGAIKEINANIRLLEYRIYGEDILALQEASFKRVNNNLKRIIPKNNNEFVKNKNIKNLDYYKGIASDELNNLFAMTQSYIESLDNEIKIQEERDSYSFKKHSKFAELFINSKKVFLRLPLDANKIIMDDKCTRDMRKATKTNLVQIEVFIRSLEELEIAKKYIKISYEING